MRSILRHQSFAIKACLWAFIACLGLMRLVAGPGFMPALSDNGTITVLICSDTGNAPQSITIPLASDNSAPAPADKYTQGKHCPFAVASQYGVLQSAPLADLGQLLVHAPQQSRLFGLKLGTASPLPPSTGPPILTA